MRQFWHPVAAVAELDGDGPHAIRLLGDDYALAKLAGEWALLPARCPHRFAPLTAGTIVEDRLQCAYHGWCFDRSGTCVDIPALGADASIPPAAHVAAAAQVTERYGFIWVVLDEPLTPIPEVPEWEDDRFGLAVLPTQIWNASAAQMADNFLDVAHFGFTHIGTIGDPNDVEVGPYSVDRDGWSFEAVHHHKSKVLADATSGETADFSTFDRTMTFRLDAPHHVRLHIDYGADGDLVLMFFHQPIDVDNTAVYLLMLAENMADGRMTPDEHIAFQTAVGTEDRDLLEQLVVKAVPLDLTAECHTRADKITVELRRVLADVDALANGR
jgi:vanillate O-demethylase monooxygenase subunit